ncbi:receptor-like protein 6 [Solanum verrucosum]|uniref:receptor-like protein 6 n=1 Tax=Solanum verrucosum TaxID=315347 RepID=UPI0020CFFCFC|nr:receptor-like protein 6 [Solanum verrucosum]
MSSNSRVDGQCLRDQMASLLKLKHELTFDSSMPKKIVRWNRNTDCCLWSSVSCDEEGHVLALELDNEAISGGVDNSSSLFDLQHLEKLNLAYNDLRSLPIPTDIYKLANLTYLNLSQAGFEGQIPVELSRLTKLVVLDISTYNDIVGFPYSLLSLESPDLGTLVGSLANLRELYLDGVNVSLKGSEWCLALSSSLPQLRVLSMRYCEISGPIDPVLVNLPFLSVIHLDMNNLSTMVPEFLADFTKLTTLSVRWCNLFGPFPS